LQLTYSVMLVEIDVHTTFSWQRMFAEDVAEGVAATTPPVPNVGCGPAGGEAKD